LIPVSFQFQSLRSEDEIRGVILEEFGKHGSVNYFHLYRQDATWWYAEVGFEPRENPVPPWLIPLIIGVIVGALGMMFLPEIATTAMEVMMMLMMLILMATMLYSVAYPMLPPPMKEKIRRWLKYE